MFWDVQPEIYSSILWQENALGSLRNLLVHSGGAMKFLFVLCIRAGYSLSALLYTICYPGCIFILLNLATNSHA